MNLLLEFGRVVRDKSCVAYAVGAVAIATLSRRSARGVSAKSFGIERCGYVAHSCYRAFKVGGNLVDSQHVNYFLYAETKG